jgi:sulfur-oxidizing protein SoxY
MNYTKRNIIKLFCMAIPLLLTRKVCADGNPYRDRFQSYRQTFRIEPNKEETEKIIKNIIRERTISKGLVILDVPDTAEDGNVVPVHFKINCSMKGNDFPKKVHVLGLENPFPEIATYEFFPEVGKAEVSFRCRMRKSSYLMIIAEMSDGRIGLEKKYVDVMLGACS